MLGLIAALALAPTAPAIDPSTVTSGAALPIGAWWEKITVTMDADGKTQSCKYESSTASNATKPCKVVGGAEGATPAKAAGKGELSTITFERRFDPSRPGAAAVATGDTLLGREVMSLAIDAAGKVSGCKTLAVTGNMSLEYGCDEASAEKFEAGAAALAGFMTISVYGHSEHVA
jgi:hypothetical protein